MPKTIPTPESEVPKSLPKPNIPYPSRRDDRKSRDKASNQIEKILQIFQDLRFDISFTDALLLMPRFAPMIKSLLLNKEKLLELAKIPLNENYLAMLLKKLPKKLGDPGKFLIPCNFSGMDLVLLWRDKNKCASCVRRNFSKSQPLISFELLWRQSQPSKMLWERRGIANMAFIQLGGSVETLESVPKPAVNEPKAVNKPKVWSDAPIIEEYESDVSDDEYMIKPSKEQEKPIKEEDSITDVENAVLDLGVVNPLCIFFIDQRVLISFITELIKFIQLNLPALMSTGGDHRGNAMDVRGFFAKQKQNVNSNNLIRHSFKKNRDLPEIMLHEQNPLGGNLALESFFGNEILRRTDPLQVISHDQGGNRFIDISLTGSFRSWANRNWSLVRFSLRVFKCFNTLMENIKTEHLFKQLGHGTGYFDGLLDDSLSHPDCQSTPHRLSHNQSNCAVAHMR
ncbi:hypothetical protein Tco_0261064 [Tanacetum coccineum]